ncbi:MAG: hypothetical protein IJT41_09275 [Clostridia bacterium]|nr:hypothetical protein [Clostridia bacterium]
MKKSTILPAVLALLLSLLLASCGTDDGRRNTTRTTTTARGAGTTTTTTTTTTTRRQMDDVIRDNGETVSEMFSEGFSAMREDSILDPQNGIISDTQPN